MWKERIFVAFFHAFERREINSRMKSYLYSHWSIFIRSLFKLKEVTGKKWEVSKVKCKIYSSCAHTKQSCLTWIWDFKDMIWLDSFTKLPIYIYYFASSFDACIKAIRLIDLVQWNLLLSCFELSTNFIYSHHWWVVAREGNEFIGCFEMVARFMVDGKD